MSDDRIANMYQRLLNPNEFPPPPKTLEEAYQNADPKVMALFQTLRVQLILPPADVRWTVDGQYDSFSDQIWARDTLMPHGDLSSYLLHELVHWTGHPSRVSRFISTGPSTMDVPHGRETEEYIAQYGMVILAEALGIIPNALEYLHFYMSNFYKFDAEAGRELAHKAVGYIKMLAPQFFGQPVPYPARVLPPVTLFDLDRKAA